MLPLAIPTVATISLFHGTSPTGTTAANALYYVDNEKLYSIQQLLMKIMNNIQALQIQFKRVPFWEPERWICRAPQCVWQWR